MSDLIEDLGNLFNLGADLATGKTSPSDLFDAAVGGKGEIVEAPPAQVLRLVPKDSGGTACDVPEPVPVAPEAAKL